MSSLLHFYDYAVICVMMGISAGVGIYFRLTGGRQKTTLEFLMADKNMTILPVTFSVLATMMSAISVLGTPAEAYLYGTQMLTRELSNAIGTLMVIYWILPVYFEMEVETIFEYLEKRFGKVTRICVSLLYVVQMILYMPVVIYAPSLAINLVTGLSLWTCVISVAVVCTFYSTMGGLKAVLWTDLFQGVLMLATIYVLIIKGCLDFGGFHDVYKTAEDGERLELFNTSMDLTVRYTLLSTLANGLIWGLYFNGSTFTIVQRLMSCGNLKRAQSGLLWSIPLIIFFQTGVCLLGITMYSYFHDCDPISDKVVTSGDQLVPFFVLKLFRQFPGFPGFCIAGILSAALSTMSSVVNSLVAVTLEDFTKPFMKCVSFKESTATLLAKMLALFYGALCLLLTFILANAKGLLETSVLTLALIGAPTFGIFSLGMFTTTANECGAVIALTAGLIMGAWFSFGSLYSKFKYPHFPLSTAGCLNGTSQDAFTRTFNDSQEERYVFPLYKVSYIWITTIGFLSTVIAGYIISFILGFCIAKKEVKTHYLSPVVRKWLCKSSESHTREEYIKMPQAIHQVEMYTRSDEEKTDLM